MSKVAQEALNSLGVVSPHSEGGAFLTDSVRRSLLLPLLHPPLPSLTHHATVVCSLAMHVCMLVFPGGACSPRRGA